LHCVEKQWRREGKDINRRFKQVKGKKFLMFISNV